MQPPDDAPDQRPSDRLRADGGEPSAAGDDDDDGRSTAFWIAIALVLAIPVLIVVAVVAAAVIGSFVLGIGGGDVPQTPIVEWEGSYDAGSGEVVFAHDGGDPVARDALSVRVDGAPTDDWSASSARLTAGDEVVVSGVESGQRVELVWQGDGEPATIASHVASG